MANFHEKVLAQVGCWAPDIVGRPEERCAVKIEVITGVGGHFNIGFGWAIDRPGEISL